MKLRKWYDRLSEYKKAGLVRTGLRRRGFAEIYQMFKKRSTIMIGIPITMKQKCRSTANFLKKKKTGGI
jgi:hypothetical protein